MKKIIALVLCAVLCVGLLSACGEKQTNGDTNSDLTLALVVAGTFGDRSFYDSSKEGCDALAKEGVKVKTIECNNENHAQQIRNAADSAKIVVLVGWEFYECGDHRSGVPGRAVHLDR